jgi:hypothetical protein
LPASTLVVLGRPYRLRVTALSCHCFKLQLRSLWTSLASDLLVAVDRRAHRVRTVAQALQNDRWVADITGTLSALGLQQYLALWDLIQAFGYVESAPDRFCWKWTTSGQYSTSSSARPVSSALRSFKKPERHQCANSSFGLPVAGCQRGCSVTACPIVVHARYARRMVKYCRTCCLRSSALGTWCGGGARFVVA